MSGQLGSTGEPTVVEVLNEAIVEVSIRNNTPNHGHGAQGHRTNAGGMVTVERSFGQQPTRHDGDYEDNHESLAALAVLWAPEVHWVLGNTFTIVYTDFDSDEEVTVTVQDYIDSSGNLKPLNECSTDNPDGLKRFLEADAYLEFSGDAVRLVLSAEVEHMPSNVRVYVQFLPTLAVNNVTPNKTGGNVRVVNGGTMNNCSDGVPAFYGVPYVSYSVYGIADPGFRVDMAHIAVRNLNDLDGAFVLLEPDSDGAFTAQLRTVIAGSDEVVTITGEITIGSILIEFDSKPVPLQVDLRFIRYDTTGGTGNTPGNNAGNNTTGGDGSNGDSNNGNGNNAGSNTANGDAGDGTGERNDTRDLTSLPRTGIESAFTGLLLGLLISLTATLVIIIIMLFQNAKRKEDVRGYSPASCDSDPI